MREEDDIRDRSEFLDAALESYEAELREQSDAALIGAFRFEDFSRDGGEAALDQFREDFIKALVAQRRQALERKTDDEVVGYRDAGCIVAQESSDCTQGGVRMKALQIIVDFCDLKNQPQLPSALAVALRRLNLAIAYVILDCETGFIETHPVPLTELNVEDPVVVAQALHQIYPDAEVRYRRWGLIEEGEVSPRLESYRSESCSVARRPNG